jgi:hypothetical protein
MGRCRGSLGGWLLPVTARPRGEAAVYTIEVEDIREAFETLRSRGVQFEPPEILEFPWGYAQGSRIRTGICSR